MTARIFKPCKSAAQPGSAGKKQWALEFTLKERSNIDPIMGWSSGEDPYPSQVKLYFTTMEEAVNYAKNASLDFEVIAPNQPTHRTKSYVNIYK